MIELKLGDQVRYSAEWCRNTGNQTGDIPFARGEVKRILNPGSDRAYADILWDGDHTVCVLSVNLEVFDDGNWINVKDGSWA